MEKKVIHIISHTHWDREWYETRESFNYRLIKLIDNLLLILKNNPLYSYFILDGSSVYLEDYIEARPEKEKEIKDFVRSGRLIIGPWYILPDEFIITAETHIRNLLLGMEVSSDFGESMKIGYIIDTFGHIAQMPQILKKSGIETAVFWRGLKKEIKDSELFWKSPDGSRVFVIYVPFGYAAAADLPFDEENLKKRFKIMIDKLSPYAKTKHILFMNGSDHVEPDPKLPQKLSLARKCLPNLEIIHSNFSYLINKLQEELKDEKLRTVEGELRADDVIFIFNGVLSSRIGIKQKHRQITNILEKEIEPMASLLYVLGIPYPDYLIKRLWKYILKSSSHDLLGGGGIDAIYEELRVRYRALEDDIRKIKDDFRKAFQDLLDTKAEDNLIIFNPHPFPVTSYIETSLFLNKKKISEVDFSISRLVEYETQKEELYSSIKLKNNEEEIIPIIKEKKWSDIMETPTHTLPIVFRGQEYKIGFLAKNLPPLGFRVYQIFSTSERLEEYGISDQFILENEFYKIDISLNGEMSIFDKEKNFSYPLNPSFEDGADAGDEYDYSKCQEDRIIRSTDYVPFIKWKEKNGFRQTIELAYELVLPVSLSEDRKTRSKQKTILPLQLIISLYSGVKRVDFEVRLKNKACDHRLRMLFSVPYKIENSLADDHFAVIKREAINGNISPEQNFVVLQNEDHSVMVMNKGLPEYEVIQKKKNSQLAITLLRSVGWLSRNDLLSRTGHGGWPIETPGAQCLGDHVFHLSVTTEARLFLDCSSLKESQSFIASPLVFQTPSGKGKIEGEFSFFSCSNDAIVLSAMKKREKRDEVILRFYNITSKPQKAIFHFAFPILNIKEISPIETDIDILPFSGNIIEIEFDPHEIKSFGIIFET